MVSFVPPQEIALIDCDGVLADFVGHILSYIESSVTPDKIENWNLFSHLPSKDRKRASAALNDHLFWRTLPVLDGAPEGVKAIRDKGYHVVVMTSPWNGCPHWHEARLSWLQDQFQVSFSDVLVGHRKYMVDASFFLDDKPQNIEHYKRHFGHRRIYLMDHTYNKGCTTGIRVTWDTLPGLIPSLKETSGYI